MTTTPREDTERGPRGRGRGGCGGPGCCGGHGHGHGHGRGAEGGLDTRRATLRERQRDLEQELAEVAGALRDLGAD
jgi:hypothetical protein